MIPLYYHQKKWWNVILLFLLLLPWYIRSFSSTISNHHHPRCSLFLTTTTTTQLSLSQQQSSSKEEEEEDNSITLEKENNESSSTTTKTTRTTIKKKRRRNTNSFDVRWMERFEELVEYKKKYGDCCVPQSFEANPSLGRWVRYQRFDSYKTKERVDKLNSIGFVWDAKEASWNAHVDELKSYQHKFGHVHVPQNGPPEYNKLSMWVQNQRVQYRYLMTHNTTTTTNNGDNSNSPQQLKTTTKTTTTTKQNKKKKSFLTPQRVATLESLGFVWDMNEVHWMEKWQMLKQFKEQYGHANVPSRYESNPTLARWVLHQRVQYKKQQQQQPPTTTTTTDTVTTSASLSSSDNASSSSSSSSSSSKRLTPKRIDLLNSLNFVWDPSDSYWWEQYRALYNYRKENGHCSIPSNFYNLKLVHWVHNQRRLCREYVIAVSGMTTTTTTTTTNNNNNNNNHHPSNNNNNNSSSSSSSSSWIPKDDIVIPVSGLNYERVVALRKIDFCWLPPLPGENSSTINTSNPHHHQQQQQQQQQQQHQQNSNLNKNNLFGTPTNHNHNREIMTTTTTTTTTTKKPQVMQTPPSRKTTTTIRIMPDGTKKQIIPFPWDEI